MITSTSVFLEALSAPINTSDNTVAHSNTWSSRKGLLFHHLNYYDLRKQLANFLKYEYYQLSENNLTEYFLPLSQGKETVDFQI